MLIINGFLDVADVGKQVSVTCKALYLLTCMSFVKKDQ